jgi:hypothetical protein
MPRVDTEVVPGTGELRISFDPSPDTWTYVKDRAELRGQLTDDVYAWLEQFPEDAPVTDERLQKLRARVLYNILAWVSQGWVVIP